MSRQKSIDVASSMHMLELQILNQSTHKIPRAFLTAWVTSLARELQRQGWHFEYSQTEPTTTSAKKSLKFARSSELLKLPRSGESLQVARSSESAKLSALKNQVSVRKTVSPQPSSLTLVFLDAPKAKKLNKQFRGKNYATDVLSFAPTEPESLGELVICPEVIVRQAREHKLSQKHEYGYMVLHGILHLLGFDHERSSAEELRMFDLQDKIFEALSRKF